MFLGSLSSSGFWGLGFNDDLSLNVDFVFDFVVD